MSNPLGLPDINAQSPAPPSAAAPSINTSAMTMTEKLIRQTLESDPAITELEFNHFRSVFIKKSGKRVQLQTQKIYPNQEFYAEDIMNMIPVIQPDTSGKFIAEGVITLSTGERARIHIVLPPVCDVPQITVARRSGGLRTLKELMSTRSFDTDIYNFLVACAGAKCTMVVSGGTGSGKTTLLEAITREISPNVRFGVCEDSPELQLQQPNTIYMHSTVWTPGTNMNEVAALAWCVQQLNRQRVDRIIVGETRGKEFNDFIVAANSGCDGSLTTIHANEPKSALQKMSGFMLEANPQPIRTVNQSIANTVDVIIQIGFNNYGQNKVLSVSSVERALAPGDAAEISLHEIFKYDQDRDVHNKKGPSDMLRNKLESAGYDPNRQYKFFSNMNVNQPPRSAARGLGDLQPRKL